MKAKAMQPKLAKVLAPESIIVEPELCAAYIVDGKQPAAVVHPQTAQQVGQILALCAQEGWAVIPWGGGTGIGIGNVPRAYDLALDLAGLDAVIEYDPDNLTLTAGAGCTLKVLGQLLGEKRQFLPLDPPLSDRATLGGVLASNAFGPSRWRYGSARDLTLGLEVALTTGDVIEVGGKTVKNVAGYDLTKLFIGSFGTLGVITAATCRLLPLPASSQTLLLGFHEVESAFTFVRQIVDSKLLPTRLDLLRGSPLVDRPGIIVSLVIGIDGSPETVERQVRDISALAGAAKATFVEVLEGHSAERAKELVRDLPASNDVPLVLRAGLPLASVPRFWVSTEQIGQEHRACVSLMARAGLGFVYVLADAEAATLIQLVHAVRSLAGEAGGYAIVERMPSRLKEQVDVWGPTREDWPLMHALKTRFDPKGILSPGRFVGRL